MRQDVDATDKKAVKDKERAILQLCELLSRRNDANGTPSALSYSRLLSFFLLVDIIDDSVLFWFAVSEALPCRCSFSFFSSLSQIAIAALPLFPLFQGIIYPWPLFFFSSVTHDVHNNRSHFFTSHFDSALKGLRELIKQVRPFLGDVSKAKGGKLFKELIDRFVELTSATAEEVRVCAYFYETHGICQSLSLNDITLCLLFRGVCLYVSVKCLNRLDMECESQTR